MPPKVNHYRLARECRQCDSPSLTRRVKIRTTFSDRPFIFRVFTKRHATTPRTCRHSSAHGRSFVECHSASEENPTLHETLAREKLADLAAAAREQGDAQRGAALFFQHALSCARCHDHDVGTPLGPDLTKLERTTTDEYLLEAVLYPSKQIKKGYETTLLTLHDGRTITGIVAEEKPDALFLLDQAVGAKRLEIAKRDIDERTASPQSLMPEGLVNVLSDRQQFLDLAKYLLEVRTGGAPRAKELRPAITALVIPEYEKELDHAGLLKGLDNKSLKRGEAIYHASAPIATAPRINPFAADIAALCQAHV